MENVFFAMKYENDIAAAVEFIQGAQCIDLYDFLADNGGEPYGNPESDSRVGLQKLCILHVCQNGPGALLEWFENNCLQIEG